MYRVSSAGSGSVLRMPSTAPARATFFANGINYADYNTWNIGFGFTYKVFTLDLRYSDTDLSKGDCNAFTSDFNATGTTERAPRSIRAALAPTGAARPASPSCRLDLTAMTNLK